MSDSDDIPLLPGSFGEPERRRPSQQTASEKDDLDRVALRARVNATLGAAALVCGLAAYFSPLSLLLGRTALGMFAFVLGICAIARKPRTATTLTLSIMALIPAALALAYVAFIIYALSQT